MSIETNNFILIKINLGYYWTFTVDRHLEFIAKTLDQYDEQSEPELFHIITELDTNKIFTYNGLVNYIVSYNLDRGGKYCSFIKNIDGKKMVLHLTYENILKGASPK